jgi:hypothetical protein
LRPADILSIRRNTPTNACAPAFGSVLWVPFRQVLLRSLNAAASVR